MWKLQNGEIFEVIEILDTRKMRKRVMEIWKMVDGVFKFPIIDAFYSHSLIRFFVGNRESIKMFVFVNW